MNKNSSKHKNKQATNTSDLKKKCFMVGIYCYPKIKEGAACTTMISQNASLKNNRFSGLL